MRQHPQTYALTSATHQRRHVFQRPALAELLIATLFRYRDAGKFLLHGFVVMPDHVHVLLTPTAANTIERSAQLIKGGFSFAVRHDYPGDIWQTGYHAHRVTDEADFHAQRHYLEQNPARQHLSAYPHIHTATPYAIKLDPPPSISPKSDPNTSTGVQLTGAQHV